MQRSQAQSARRAAVTLIELLVVVTILVMLMAYATSIIKPTMEDRKSRETAQLLKSYIMKAQARAAELGRPVGIYLQRSENDDNKVLQIYTAVTPPPFIGSVIGSRAEYVGQADNSDIRWVSGGFDIDEDGAVDVTWIYRCTVEDPNGNQDLLVSRRLVREGDEVRFDFKGPRYRIVYVGDTSTGDAGVFEYCSPIDNAWSATPYSEPAYLQQTGLRIPIQIFRRPQKSIAAPIELPTGMAIDLAASGFGPQSNDFIAADADSTTPDPTDDRTPIVIMFGPTGDVDHIYFKGQKIRPLQPIHLLVGSYEYPLDTSGTQPYTENLDDDRNRWITIRPRGGEVNSTEVVLNADSPNTKTDIATSRSLTIDLRGGS